MTKPTIQLQELQARIGTRAKTAPAHRFWGLYTHVKKLEVLETAYLEAKKNKGAPGSDGITFEDIERSGRAAFLTQLAAELATGTYKALPHRKVDIPKEKGRTRTLSIGAIRDRVVQGALKLVLEPIFEADFSDSSFGARPGRRAHDAITRIREALVRRQHYVVDVDLAAFFDNIAHAVILSRLAARIQDPQMLALLKRFLKGAGKCGIPQGSPLSPLLANVALNDLDHALDRGKGVITYARYLDDMVVSAHNSPKGRRWADRALQRIKEEALAVGVRLNEEKTRTVTLGPTGGTFAFLGFDIRWARSPNTKKWYPHSTPRQKKVTAVQEKVRELLQKQRHHRVEDVIRLLNPILRGWVNYFKVGNSTRAFSKLRRYVELAVRRFAMRQRQRRGHGWKRWSSRTVYGTWGLYNAYKVSRYNPATKAAPA